MLSCPGRRVFPSTLDPVPRMAELSAGGIAPCPPRISGDRLSEANWGAPGWRCHSSWAWILTDAQLIILQTEVLYIGSSGYNMHQMSEPAHTIPNDILPHTLVFQWLTETLTSYRRHRSAASHPIMSHSSSSFTQLSITAVLLGSSLHFRSLRVSAQADGLL